MTSPIGAIRSSVVSLRSTPTHYILVGIVKVRAHELIRDLPNLKKMAMQVISVQGPTKRGVFELKILVTHKYL